MKYFLHDTSAFDDEKITELYLKFGYEGLGLFYTALEKIGKQEKPIKTEILKAQLKVGKRLQKCWSFMEQIGILSSSNGETFNEQLLNFSEKYQIKKEKTRKKVSEWRAKQLDTENVTDYVPVSNLPKVKLSKVKNIINSENNILTHEEIQLIIKEKKDNFRLALDPFKELYNRDILNGFYRHWTEPNKSKRRNGIKIKWELEPTWDIKGRLITWETRSWNKKA